MDGSQLSPRFRCPDPVTRHAPAAGTRAVRAFTELPKTLWVLWHFGCDGSNPPARQEHSQGMQGQHMGRVPTQCPAVTLPRGARVVQWKGMSHIPQCPVHPGRAGELTGVMSSADSC